MAKKYLILVVSVAIFTLLTTSVMAQGKSSPFLITGTIPHLTKLLMQQWDNPELNLSAQQKTDLLQVRAKTLTNVKKIAPEIGSLEQQVAEGIFAGQTPVELSSMVFAIAKLKAEETMIQLECIDTTSKILDQQQLEILLD
jgi:hypothetical protein